MRLFTAVTALALFAPVIAAAGVVNQCADVSIRHNLVGSLLNAVLNLLSPFNSSRGCPAFCARDRTHAWSLYQPGLLGILGTCYCLPENKLMSAGWVRQGKNAGGDCNPGTFQVTWLQSEGYQFGGCTKSVTTVKGARIAVSDAKHCYKECANRNAMVLTPTKEGIWFCECADAATPGPLDTCGPDVSIVYANTPAKA